MELAAEIGRAANFVDVLVPMRKSYSEVHAAFVVASRKGYFICVDNIPGEPGQSIYPGEAAQSDDITICSSAEELENALERNGRHD